jgi:hypothetical protein
MLLLQQQQQQQQQQQAQAAVRLLLPAAPFPSWSRLLLKPMINLVKGSRHTQYQ